MESLFSLLLAKELVTLAATSKSKRAEYISPTGRFPPLRAHRASRIQKTRCPLRTTATSVPCTTLPWELVPHINARILKEFYRHGLIVRSAFWTDLPTCDRVGGVGGRVCVFGGVGGEGGILATTTSSSKPVPRCQPSEGEAEVDCKCHAGVAWGTWAILTPPAQIWTLPALHEDNSSILTPPPTPPPSHPKYAFPKHVDQHRRTKRHRLLLAHNTTCIFCGGEEGETRRMVGKLNSVIPGGEGPGKQVK